jgi:hypothetical protein
MLDKIMEFVHRCSVDPHRSQAVLKAVIALLGDLGDFLGDKMYHIMSEQYVVQLLQQGSQDEDIREIAQWTQSIVMKVRQER